MYLYEIIPLTYIPRPASQVLSYYYPKKLARFSLVEILIGKKKYPALLVGSENVKDLKLFLRAASFEVKEMKGIICDEPVISEWQFKLALWIADYYWTSLGVVIKKFIPSYLFKKSIPYTINALPSNQTLYLFPDTSYFERVSLPRDCARISSQISEKKEFTLFQEVAAGAHRVIAGTKRSLFLPYQGLKEIHIFEEADHNHISWDQHPKYSAVKVAQKLAELHGAKIIYHSTLPSLRLFYENTSFKILDGGRKGGNVEIIDLTKEKLQKPFSQALTEVIENRYSEKEKMILYLNRRGSSRFLLCRDCGFVPKCPNCEVSLVFHIFGISRRILLCHHCGYKEKPPTLCSQCGSHNIRLYGFGTERVEAELKTVFPKAAIMRLDSDTAKSEKEKQKNIQEFTKRGDFLVATSMIFGTLVKSVHTVAALSADAELNIPDFAQSEKLFFNLWRLKQFAKRSFYIQTYNPSLNIFTSLASGKWQDFYREELKIRRSLNYPPFSSIITLTYSHKNEQKAREEAEILAKKLQQQILSFTLHALHFTLLGPVPAFLPKLRGKYYYNILIKLQVKSAILKTDLLSVVPAGWEVEVDPVNSL